MSQGTRSTKSSGRTRTSAYLWAWGTVACCGLAYVGVAATRPDLLAAILPLAEPASTDSASAPTLADMADEVATLRKWVNDLQHDVAATRSALQEQASQQTTLAQRVSAAEERLAPVREAKAEPPARTPPASKTARAAQATQPPSTPAPAGPQAVPDVANVRVLNAGTSPITTGSVEPPAVPAAVAPAVAAPPRPARFAAPKVVPPSRPRGIEIGSAESLEGLRARWGDIAGKNSGTVGDLAPRYRLATDGRASPFTLVAGPFDNTADATKACAQLRAKGIACRVGDYAGSAF